MNPSPTRMPLLDALKGAAAQLVLLHHFALYGPLALAFADTYPDTAEWLVDYGRMAVQVFLVCAGFLAARGLAPEGRLLAGNPLPLIGRRYLRLALPFVAAISIAVIVSAIADQWLDDPAVPDRATFGQWLAHVFLLHGVLGAESLSAGVWYVAIDFQLYAVMALLLWLGRKPSGALLAVLGLAIASLFHFNRDSSLDNWAIYFFGSYGLGAAAWWASARGRLRLWLGLIATVGIAALVEDFRLRIAIALAVALLLAFSRRSGLLERWPQGRLAAFFGRISYSVFLVHFPVLLLANALFANSAPRDAAAITWWTLVTWGACIGAGMAFHRWIEVPAGKVQMPALLRQWGRRALQALPGRG